jgi:Methyltransferase domain
MTIPTLNELMVLTSTVGNYNLLQDAECHAMYDTLLQLPDGATVVEVGCDYGRSSSLIQQVAAAKNFLTIHIDPWICFPDRGAAWMQVMCEKCPYQPFILLKMTTVEAMFLLESIGTQEGARQFDMVFIDGSHDQSDVENDLRIVASHVKSGGFLTAHDYPSAGVSDAIDPFVATGWTKVRQAYGFGVWRRD